MKQLISALLILSLGMSVSSCEKSADGLEFEPCDATCLSDKLNNNVRFMRAMILAEMRHDTLIMAAQQLSGSGGESIVVTFPDGQMECYDNLDEVEGESLPYFSISRTDEDIYYWTMNGILLTDDSGFPVNVTDEQHSPRLMYDEDTWLLSLDGDQWHVIDSSFLSSRSTGVWLSYNRDFIRCQFGDACQFLLPVRNAVGTLGPLVTNKGFYKDLFLDAGYGLSSCTSLAAANYLNYSVEYLDVNQIRDTLLQNTILGGDASDLNGRLLYPDGQPRFQVLYVNGGNSRTHGRNLRQSCRDNMRTFVYQGGAYMGICAGGFFVSKGYDTIPEYKYYLGLWPGVMYHTGLTNAYIGMFVSPDSPLLRYFTFGGDNYVSNVRHNKGWWTDDRPAGTEVLARYDYPTLPSIHNKVSIMAYRSNPLCGRIVMSSSHPEGVDSGEKLELTAAMLQYAADGVGPTVLKGVLENGQPRMMDRTTDDGQPEYTMIGDLQYHHFAVYIPADAQNVNFYVDSDIPCTLRLAVSNYSYAYPDAATAATTGDGAHQKLCINVEKECVWYVSVQCTTTVTTTDTEIGQEYSGRTDVLNGIPYTVGVTWE